QVGAQPDAVAIGDPHTGGDDVVDHPRELVDAEDGDVPDGGPQPVGVEPGGLDGAGAGPGHVGQQPEAAGHVRAVRLDQPVREQVQPQPDVVGVDGRGREVRDHRADGDDLDAPGL